MVRRRKLAPMASKREQGAVEQIFLDVKGFFGVTVIEPTQRSSVL